MSKKFLSSNHFETVRMGRETLQLAFRLLALFVAILGITLLHYRTPISEPALHDIFQRLYYLPIILAAFWFGLKGGLGTSVIVSILYAPHLLFQWGGHPGMEVDRYLEILIYNLVGGVTGFLSWQEKHRRNQLEETAAGLRESYRTLQQQSDHIVRIEEQLRRAERLSILGETAAVLAHEVRNPLGSIKGATEILKDDYRPGDRKYEFIEIMLKEADRLNHVVEDFLKLSRPQPLVLGQFNIGEELRNVVMLVAAEVRDKGIRLELDADESLVVSGNRDKLHEAFLNIILNAIQSGSAGDSLRIEAGWNTEAGEDRSEVRVTFRDTGTGIPEDIRKRIFEPFFTTRQEGTGLGLAITKKIVEAHHGRIEVGSNVPRGTIFTVYLPSAQENE